MDKTYKVTKVDDGLWIVFVDNRCQMVETEGYLIHICTALNTGGYKPSNDWTKLI